MNRRGFRDKLESIKRLDILRQIIFDAEFVMKHINKKTSYSRKRYFSFQKVFVLLFQKSLKSIQLRLNEFSCSFNNIVEEAQNSVSASAWCKARLKFKHTAFIELNEKVILEPFYDSEEVSYWNGKRLLAIDGSTSVLPKSQEIREKFGEEHAANKNGLSGKSNSMGRISVIFDVMNDLALNSMIEPYRTGEQSMALKQMQDTVKQDDVVIMDRGYASFKMLASVLSMNVDFIVRCPSKSFGIAIKLHKNNKEGVSEIVTLTCPKTLKKDGFPHAIKVRFVTIRLKTGEIEVLATSLLNELTYDIDCLCDAYQLRWGIETYYERIKGRLDLENYTGKSVESIYQDFYSTTFVSNFESDLSRASQHKMDANKPKKMINSNRCKVNKAVSYNAIKSKAIELFLSDIPSDKVIRELEELFMTQPTLYRPKREVERKPQNARTSHHFARRKRKITF